MATIIKNQLVKHLSKFTRNLRPEQISLDVLRGNSKLQFIEINEEVLTDILELPTWLRIKRAYCTGVTINVPWTRLKTSPIQIFIDEINVDVELSSGPPAKRGENPLGNLGERSSYGFVDKIVENMSLYINTVEINFDSDAFGGSFMLQRLSVESRSPGWAQVQDLRQTRITCSSSNRTLTYKQLSWHLLRIEASAKTSKDEKRSKINAPLRLITSGGKIRIALKKSSIDGSVIHARIQTILEDILWVATLPQLRSAISFASYIMSLVKESQKDLVVIPTPAGLPRSTTNQEMDANSSSNTFKAFHFDQTSYHLHVKKIDLHLCDDAHTSSSYPPDWDIDSGAMQVSLYQVLIDAYPKTLATSDRSTWMRYVAPNTFTNWMHSRLSEQFEELKANAKDDTVRTRLDRCWSQLMGFHVVVRMFDLTIQCVSDMNTKKDALRNLFVTERHSRSLPPDQYIVHFEFANYFHPMTDTLPVPKAAAYLTLGPFSLTFDERTLRWSLYVAHILQSAIEDGKLNVTVDPNTQAPDLRIDLMPKIIIPLPNTISDARLPHRLVISMSTVSVSSCSFGVGQNTKFCNMSDTVIEMGKKYGATHFASHLQSIFKNNVPEGFERLYIRTSPVWVETDHGPNTKGLSLLHDIPFNGAVVLNQNFVSAYVEAAEEVTLLIDHFQFLQITRLSAKLSQFFDMLSKDQKHFNNSKAQPAPLVSFFASIRKIRVHVFLTMGPMPSPYDGCPPVTDINSSFMDRLSDMASITPRSNTPSMSRKADNALAVPKNNVPRNTSMEAFPEFPRPNTDFDVSSFVDETASVATSNDDDGNIEYEVPVEDLFGVPEIAEEAIMVDEHAFSERIFKSIMAKVGNLLIASVDDISVVGNVADGNLEINGEIGRITLLHKLAIPRQEANDLLKKKSTTTEADISKNKVATFVLKSPADDKTSYLTVDVKGLKANLDDEIISHLSAFALDDQVSENKLRLTANLTDSDIVIVDRKKKKPLKLKITGLTIEQEEDGE